MPDRIVQLRRALHQRPELSGREVDTAGEIAGFFRTLAPDELIEGLGGHGVAIVFRGAQPGPTVLLRCELDALPIHEDSDLTHRSQNAGVSHKCGHDGHMAALAAVGEQLAAHRPARGRVVLLYQPAEENGRGAAAVIDDPRFDSLRPDFAFAFHNLPGFPLGQVVVRPGVFSCASRGISLEFTGATAHAAQPETGRSPALAVARVIQELVDLPADLIPSAEMAFATVVGARLGEKAFGTAPGHAWIWATLRSETDATMDRLMRHAERVAAEAAASAGLHLDIQYEDIFPATVNAERAVQVVSASTGSVHVPEAAFRWSEDFGHITALCEGALFGLGAGADAPDLHHPDYEFPDALIPVAKEVLLSITARCLAS